MGFSSLLKQLKKRLRQKRRWLALGFWLLLIGAAFAASSLLQNGKERVKPVDGKQSVGALSESVDLKARLSQNPPGHRHNEQFIQALKDSKGKWEVVHKSYFVCGEGTEILGSLNSKQILQILEKHPQWEASAKTEKVVFSEHIDDLSPKCKENAYFGLDENGNLSLFEGLPANNQVIRTFFQLNIEHLKSSLPRETVQDLYEGIRISDFAEYNSVLSTFSDFAVEETESVMKPTE